MTFRLIKIDVKLSNRILRYLQYICIVNAVNKLVQGRWNIANELMQGGLSLINGIVQGGISSINSCKVEYRQ